MAILISACLLGVRCRYDGESRPLPREILERLEKAGPLVPVCPEQLGGLPTPRPPAERSGEKILCADGRDVTEPYRRGAQEALRIAGLCRCGTAVLKARSPSCGKGTVYDGTHTRTLTGGNGVAAELLLKNGIRVLTEEEIGELTGGEEETASPAAEMPAL